MNFTIDSLAPSLPPGILFPATAILLVLLLVIFWRVKDRVANYVIFAAWFRYMASAYHVITFKPLLAGLSMNACGSIGVLFLGLLVIRPRNLLLKFLVPCYLSMAVAIASGLGNHRYSGIVTVTAKYGYFIVVTLGVFQALGRIGERRFMSVLLWAFAPLLVLQALSIAFGIGKASEADGSVSYIGGYNHEAAFSVSLATCFVVACFADNLKPIIRNAILLLCLIGIFLANYRTTIIAIAPLVIAQFSLGIVDRFRRDQRLVVGMGMCVISFLAVIVASWFLRQRFQDLAIVAEAGGMIKPPGYFTSEEARLMSARPHIWSLYIYRYAAGGFLQHVIGFGPESWVGVFSTYAHNTLISYLYEYGVTGVATVLYFWYSMAAAAFRIRQGPRGRLLAAHASFIVLNMATMPLWLIEGHILYAIICGYTLYLLQRRPVFAGQLATPQRRHRGSSYAGSVDGVPGAR